MTTKRIVSRQPNGAIAITCPSPNSRLEDETETDWLDRIAVKDLPKDWVRLQNHDISDLEGPFMDALRDDGTGRVKVDMKVAREQKLFWIRYHRKEKFPSLDSEWMKATGQKNFKRADEIEAKRQMLRDIPKIIDLKSLKTPEELEAFEPDWPTL